MTSSRKFRAALKANDSVSVAGMTRLPYEADNSIRDAAQFRTKIYLRDFTAKNRAWHPAWQSRLRSRRQQQRQLLHLLRPAQLRLHEDAGGVPFDGYRPQRLINRPRL
jgi:hypothetical protein